MSSSSLTFLKQLKNRTIGNPTAKLTLARNGDIPAILSHIDPTNHEENKDEYFNEIRIEAANVITSLAHGSDEVLLTLFEARADEVVLFAISALRPHDPELLKTALIRSLKNLITGASEIVGPPLWGPREVIRKEYSDARNTLDYLLKTESLDVYLPFLNDASIQNCATVAQLLSTAIRLQEHQKAIVDWVPISERVKEIPRKRGWETGGSLNTRSASQKDPWAAKQLVMMLSNKDPNVQAAALLALAALAKENLQVSSSLIKSLDTGHEESPAVSTALTLCKSRRVAVRLAAALCTARILRTTGVIIPPQFSATWPWTLLNMLDNVISDSSVSYPDRTHACFVFYSIVVDDRELSSIASKCGSLAVLAKSLQEITPSFDPPETWDPDERENIYHFREGLLYAITALCLFDKEVRHEAANTYTVPLQISTCLTHPRIGVRLAACHCARALTRDVAILRTTMLDSGLGKNLLKAIEKTDEDTRVVTVALACVCNMVNFYSPLRSTSLTSRLSTLMGSEVYNVKLNALWAIKNILYKATQDEKEEILKTVKLQTLLSMLSDSDPTIQEQVLSAVTNIATDESSTALLFDSSNQVTLLDGFKKAFESPNDDVLRQALTALANIACGSASHRDWIISHTKLLSDIRNSLEYPKAEVRLAAVQCVRKLAERRPYKHKALRDSGIESTLSRLSRGTGTVAPAILSTSSMSPRVPHEVHNVHSSSVEGEIRNAARRTLHCISNPDDYTILEV